ncbi:MAG TPA: hypothetical protein VGN35_07285 [Jatrophihabitantaceae bacterium]|jgi:hypothetical protein|nr:hypothetical protein [Jatrophihabitantaceae bacterium]
MQFSTLARVALVSFGAAMTVGLGAGVATAAQTDPPACEATATSSSCVPFPPDITSVEGIDICELFDC